MLHEPTGCDCHLNQFLRLTIITVLILNDIRFSFQANPSFNLLKLPKTLMNQMFGMPSLVKEKSHNT